MSSAAHGNRTPPGGSGGSAEELPDLVLRYVVIVLQALMHCGLLQVWSG